MSHWQTVLAIDFDKWAVETYRANFPGVDVRCALVADLVDSLPNADVILGGPPCQPFSLAGNGEGEADKRDGIPDFTSAVIKGRPRQFLMESVPGLLSARHRHHLGRAIERIEREGYVVQWREFNSANFGVPQFRTRVWVWGISRLAGVAHRWPMITHAWPAPISPSMFGVDFKTAITVGQAIGSLMGEMTMKSWPIGYWGKFSSRHPHAILDRPAPTLPCDWITTQSIGLVEIPGTGMMRNFTPREGMRIQSGPDDFSWPAGITVDNKTRIIGNGWASRMAWVMSEALRKADPHSRTVIDLFCGGGLGAVGWHGRYWKYQTEEMTVPA